MNGFVENIAFLTLANPHFRKVLYTAAHCQLVLMSLDPSGDIGEEVHDVDQFFRVESGTGQILIDGISRSLQAGYAAIVPAGARHNIVNSGDVPLKLYTLYAPPHHRDGVIHHQRSDADVDDEHFDGRTTQSLGHST